MVSAFSRLAGAPLDSHAPIAQSDQISASGDGGSPPTISGAIHRGEPANSLYDNVSFAPMAAMPKSIKTGLSPLERRASFRTHKGRSISLIEHRNGPKTDSTFRSDALEADAMLNDVPEPGRSHERVACGAP